MTDTSQKHQALAPVRIELPRELLYTAHLAVECYAYWSADEYYRNQGYSHPPYSDDPRTSRLVARAVALGEQIEAALADQDAQIGVIELDTDDRVMLEEALDELVSREELERDDDVTPETILHLTERLEAAA